MAALVKHWSIVSVLLTAALASGTLAAEIAGRVLAGTNQIDVVLLSAPAASNLLHKLEQAIQTQSQARAQITDLQNQKTLLVYRSMFTETGPAAREELRGEIGKLAGRIQELDSRAEAAARQRSPDLRALETPLALTRTDNHGHFRFALPQVPPGQLWIAAALRPHSSTNASSTWVLLLPTDGKSLILSVTNALGVQTANERSQAGKV